MLLSCSFAPSEKIRIFARLMKNLTVYIVFFITCFYFLSAGNLSLFSKLGKDVQTELCDLDEDATDSEGKEAKDSKEDGCDEEVFLELFSDALLPGNAHLNDGGFHDPHFALSSNYLEKIAPPPRA